jgi:DNA-binding GntR family transcriptional regulator
MSETYESAPETIRRALSLLRDEGLTMTQSTRGTFVLRAVTEPEPSPEYVRLIAALDDVLGRLGKVEERLAELEDQGSGRR